jgi:hypothetical protein
MDVFMLRTLLLLAAASLVVIAAVLVRAWKRARR